MATKPTIVFVPGSFSPQAMYAVFIDHLEFIGNYEVIFVDLPSIIGRGKSLPPPTMLDDSQAIRSVIEDLVAQDKSVVLITHSYGGVPGTESLAGMTSKERSAKGHKGGVQQIIYTTSVVPPLGGSLQTEFEGYPAGLKPIQVHEDGYLTLDPEIVATTACSNLPHEEGVEQSRRFLSQSGVSFTGELTHTGYFDAPVSYVLCTEDITIPPELQEKMIKQMIDSGAKVTVHELKADHCWNTSVPRYMAQKIMQILEELV